MHGPQRPLFRVRSQVQDNKPLPKDEKKGPDSKFPIEISAPPNLRLEAFFDVLWFTSSVVWDSAIKVGLVVANYFGFLQEAPKEHAPKIKQGSTHEYLINNYIPKQELLSDGAISHQDRAYFMFHCCHEVMKGIMKQLPARKLTNFFQTLESFADRVIENPGNASIKSIPKFYEDLLNKQGASKEIIQQFREELIKIQGIKTPKEISRKLVFTDPSVGKKMTFQEKATTLNCELGAKYLEAADKELYADKVAYIREHHAGGIRTSLEKTSKNAQAMTINGRIQSVEAENVPITTVLRSGAFAVHDGAKEGLSELNLRSSKFLPHRRELEFEIEKLTWAVSFQDKGIVADKFKEEMINADWFKNRYPNPTNEIIKKELNYFQEILSSQFKLGALNHKIEEKFTGEGSDFPVLVNDDKHYDTKEVWKEQLEIQISSFTRQNVLGNEIEKLESQMNNSVRIRTDLLVAQALPKIAASIKEMVNNSASIQIAMKTGSFLHVEQSLLSDEASDERVMIQDMQGVLDHLRENTTIKFTKDPLAESVTIDEEGHIILTLHTAVTFPDNFPDELGLTALFFTQGVNIHQSVGHFFSNDTVPLQETINLNSTKLLKKYANDAGKSKDVEALRDHYKTNRHSKDMKGIRILETTVKSLGGNRGVVCKSGKDRTAAETNYTLAENTVKQLMPVDQPTRPPLPRRKADSELKDLFQESLQYELSGGVSLAIVAQNTGGDQVYKMQWESLPANWRPPKEFCKVDLTGRET